MTSRAVTLDWNRAFDAPAGLGRLSPPAGANEPIRLIHGDNLSVLECSKEELGGRVTLAYLDPPFFTGKPHTRVTRTRDADSGDILRERTLAFDDRWSSLARYLDALAPRLQRIFDCLTSDGCLVLHVDSKTSHYLKVLCDELFGGDCFASEIIWRYRRWPAKTANFQRVHDVLLRYTKTPGSKAKFQQLFEPLAPSTLKTWGTGKQRAIVDSRGRRRRSSSTESASPGTPLGDVWDIGIVAPVARERTGYPTQKPVALLQRLVRALTEPGDLVLDPYAGSGTTLVSAAELGRRVVGIDESPEALKVIRQRLLAASLPYVEQAYVNQTGKRRLAS